MSNINDTIFYVKREEEERHTEELAKKLNLPYTNLVSYPLTRDVLSYVDENSAILCQLVPYLKVGKTIKIGAVDPNSDATKNFLEKYRASTGFTVSISLISKASFLYGISFYEKYKTEEAVKQQTKEEEEDVGTEIENVQSVADAVKKVNTTKLLDVILLGAIKTKSSDIHLEPSEKTCLVRYRIDGILQDVVTLSVEQYKSLLSRIKFLSKLRMDVQDAPQDGRFSFNIPGDLSEESDIDLRVSIMPSSFGESIVLRLLGQEKSILMLDRLGFRPEALSMIKKAIAKPYGMILTSGPTGSGKTSTLYAVLMELKKPGVKIITLENPVEYRIEGIEQSQVKPGQGYEFADGLKASLRQDPDILMVGEIRDPETAEIAVQASLTGHLLLSTIHANSAPAVFPRLIEIGVKPFLLSGSINIVMAQRLVRKICPKCQEEYIPAPETWEEVKETLLPVKSRLDMNIQKVLDGAAPKLRRGKGCKDCSQSGYLGRQVIVEVLKPDDTIEALISKKASIAEFTKTAQNQGMISMEQDGLSKALIGTTTIEEVWRVTKS
ncbi:MAG: GspE/PulE family protein [Patescibacteria group bacterium]|nr:GspE/PulE family protein [Patescibacteria group bacterium]